MDHILEFDGVCKSFFEVAVLRDVSFPLSRGHVLGLIGENGAGKSTLMNILGGVLAADSGEIRFEGRPIVIKSPQQAVECGIAFIHQELNLFSNLSIAENLFIPRFPKYKAFPLIDKKKMRNRAQQLLQSVGLNSSPDVVVSSLSPGERQLIEIAKALNTEAKVLILDEPTSSLTQREGERLFSLIEGLRSRGMSMIYISHLLADVLRLCDDICVLRDGEVVTHGPKDEFSINKMISFMTGHNVEDLYPARDTRPSKEAALEVRSISQSGVVRDLSLTLHKREVLGLFGLMGSGRTELARMIFGLDAYEEGVIVVGGVANRRPTPSQSIRRGVAFLTEDRRDEGLFMDASVSDNIAQVALASFSDSGFLDKDRLTEAVTEAGTAVGLSANAYQMREVKSLSGGNQQKVVLARWFLAKPKVMILDEPTRGIDVGAKYEIYKLINKFAADGGAVLFISSEIEELFGLCDRILVMRNGELRDELMPTEFNNERILRSAFGAQTIQ
jgi:ribose transport system ATP-binding protein